MQDSFVNALNTQKATMGWMDSLTENMVNLYTPGYRENLSTFKTFLNGSVVDNQNKKLFQGKAIPGTSKENIFLEGDGYFTLRRDDGKLAYTRLGEFKFDNEGVYKSTDGMAVQGYILNDKGEIMSGSKPVDKEMYENTLTSGGTMDIPTTQIKLWIDPDNGKYLGKYDEFEFKEDGVLYGKSNNGKNTTPLYKVVLSNFHNPEGLYEYKQGTFVETSDSGKRVMGRGEVRSGLIEMSNIDFKGNIAYYQQAKLQMDLANKLISTNKELLQKAMELMGS